MPSPLQDPLPLPCGTTLPNRIAKAAMTEGLADPEDRATEAHQRLYRRWSGGGAGLLITGNVMVDRRFLERPGNVVIDGNGGRDALRAWARAGTEAGNHLWMQISHPGRQCPIVVNMRPLSPSAEKLRILGLFGKPREMTEADIEDAIQRYATTAQIAQEASFEQLHRLLELAQPIEAGERIELTLAVRNDGTVAMGEGTFVLGVEGVDGPITVDSPQIATEAVPATAALFFEPGDVVAIKLNPVGLPHVISSPETVRAIVAGLALVAACTGPGIASRLDVIKVDLERARIGFKALRDGPSVMERVETLRSNSGA